MQPIKLVVLSFAPLTEAGIIEDAHAREYCLTLLGPAAAKRQPSGAPATRSVAARLRSSRAARPREVEW